MQNYVTLCEQMVRKLGRKRICSLEHGQLKIWAAAVVYTVATMNFLFDKSFAPIYSFVKYIWPFRNILFNCCIKVAQILIVLKLKQFGIQGFRRNTCK